MCTRKNRGDSNVYPQSILKISFCFSYKMFNILQLKKKINKKKTNKKNCILHEHIFVYKEIKRSVPETVSVRAAREEKHQDSMSV